MYKYALRIILLPGDFVFVSVCVCVGLCVWHCILFLSLLDVNKKGACLWSPMVVFAGLFLAIVAVCSVFIAWKTVCLP